MSIAGFQIPHQCIVLACMLSRHKAVFKRFRILKQSGFRIESYGLKILILIITEVSLELWYCTNFIVSIPLCQLDQ